MSKAIQDFQKSKVPNESAEKLQNYIQRLTENDPTLDKINLSDCELSNRDFSLLAKALGKSKAANLTSINLSYNQISTENLQFLLESLKNKNIKTLSLMDCEISDEKTKIIADFARENESLETLFLSDNQIADTGLLHLSDALIGNKNLKNLDLANNDISDVQIEFLSSILSENSTLKKLSLAGNKITNVGAEKLIKLLANEVENSTKEIKTPKTSSNKSLIELDLTRNRTSTLADKYEFLEKFDKSVKKKDQKYIASFFDDYGDLKDNSKLNFPIYIKIMAKGERKFFILENAENSEKTLRDLYLINNQQISFENLEKLESLLGKNRILDKEKAKQMKDDQNKTIGHLPWEMQNKLLELNDLEANLDLSKSQISGVVLELALEAIQVSFSLKNLKLDLSKLSDSNLKLFFDMLKKNSSLTKIELGGKISKDALKILNSVLDKNKTLIEIDGIGFKGIGERRNLINQIQSKLSANKFLAEMEEKEDKTAQENGEMSEILSNQISDQGLETLAAALIGKNIAELNLAKNQISDEGIVKFFNSLKKNDTNLQSINLEGNEIGSGAIASIADLLQTNKTIVELNLSSSDDSIGDAEFALLVEALRENKTLKIVELGNNKITGQSIGKLVELLGQNSSLEIINLGENYLNLAQLQNVENESETDNELDLVDRSQINDEEWQPLANAIASNKNLTKLSLAKSEISYNAAKILVEAMEQNHNITDFKITYKKEEEMAQFGAETKEVKMDETLQDKLDSYIRRNRNDKAAKAKKELELAKNSQDIPVASEESNNSPVSISGSEAAKQSNSPSNNPQDTTCQKLLNSSQSTQKT